MAEPDKTKMNQPERNALVKVIRSRFSVFTKHARRTRDQLKQAIFDRLTQESEAKVNAAKRDIARIEAKLERLKGEADAVYAKHRAKGLELGSASVKDAWEYVGTRNERVGKYVDVTTFEGGLSWTISNAWVDPTIADRVEAEYRRLEEEFGLGELAMAQTEQELVEEVILGGVTSDEAQTFLGRVPTLEKLPAPADAVARLGA